MQNLYNHFLSSTGVSTDTRTISQGQMFFALRGDNFDSNTPEILQAALQGGASHVVTSNPDFADKAHVTVVPDTLAALQQLASYHRSQLTIPIVGITGTNGKTTTKELVAAVLRQKYNVYATKGNLNNHIGVPLSLLSVREHDVAVIEMGANHPHEIRDLAAIVRPTAGLVTNVGIGHILGFGSFEGVKATKAELYAQLKSSSSTVFINAGNAHLLEMLGDYDHVISYGTSEVDCHVDGHITQAAETLCFEWSVGGTLYREVKTNITGSYNLENALAAVAVGTFFDVDAADICQALSDYMPTNGRSQVVVSQRNRIIADAYNANPSSMTAAVDNFEKMTGEGKVVVLGAMRELGPVQDEEHLKLMRRLQAMKLDKVYLVGSEFAKFSAQFSNFHIVENAADLAGELSTLSQKYILLKGSNSNKLSQLLQYL